MVKFSSYSCLISVALCKVFSVDILPAPIRFQHFIKSSFDLQIIGWHEASSKIFSRKEEVLPRQSYLLPFTKSMLALSQVQRTAI